MFLVKPIFAIYFRKLLVTDRGGTVVTVLRYKSEGRWFDPSWCQWTFLWYKILALGKTKTLTEMSTRSISWG